MQKMSKSVWNSMALKGDSDEKTGDLKPWGAVSYCNVNHHLLFGSGWSVKLTRFFTSGFLHTDCEFEEIF